MDKQVPDRRSIARWPRWKGTLRVNRPAWGSVLLMYSFNDHLDSAAAKQNRLAGCSSLSRTAAPPHAQQAVVGRSGYIFTVYATDK